MTRQVFERPIQLVELIQCDADEIILRGDAAFGFLTAMREDPLLVQPGQVLVGRKRVGDPNSIGVVLGRDWFREIEVS